MNNKVEEKISSCPLCNYESILIKRGNEFTRKRSAEIECTNCHLKLVVGAIRNSLEWCTINVISKWNKRTEPTKEPSIKEDELIERIKKEIAGKCHNDIAAQLASEDCVEIAKQYTNSKLEELEKWVNENSFEEGSAYLIYFPELKSKIQSLKQQ